MKTILSLALLATVLATPVPKPDSDAQWDGGEPWWKRESEPQGWFGGGEGGPPRWKKAESGGDAKQ